METTPLLLFALLGVAFWLLVLRPAKAKQAAQRDLINRVQVGDRVMTTAGVFGYVADVTDDQVGVEIADGVIVQMVKPAIAKVIPLETTDHVSDALDGADDVDVTDVTDAAGPELGPEAKRAPQGDA